MIWEVDGITSARRSPFLFTASPLLHALQGHIYDAVTETGAKEEPAKELFS